MVWRRHLPSPPHIRICYEWISEYFKNHREISLTALLVYYSLRLTTQHAGHFIITYLQMTKTMNTFSRVLAPGWILNTEGSSGLIAAVTRLSRARHDSWHCSYITSLPGPRRVSPRPACPRSSLHSLPQINTGGWMLHWVNLNFEELFMIMQWWLLC